MISFFIDLGHCLDPEIFKRFFIALISIIEGVGPWQRYVVSMCYLCVIVSLLSPAGLWPGREIMK